MKIKTFVFTMLLIITTTFASADYFRDVVLTGTDGPWTDVRSYSSLTNAINAIGANKQTLLIPAEVTCSNLTIPSNVTLKFTKDGAINNSGQLTIQTKDIIADSHQIFTGSGDIDFADTTEVKASWFSSLATAISLTNDDGVRLIIDGQYTLSSSQTLGAEVILVFPSPDSAISTNAGATLSNISNIVSGKHVILTGDGDFDFVEGSTVHSSWFTSLHRGLAFIDDDNVNLTMIVDGNTDIDSDTTVDDYITLKVEKGNPINISAGVTLTINGTLEAGRYQVFDGDGNVVFEDGAIDVVYPEWWGDDGNAIQNAIDSLSSGTVSLGRGTSYTNCDNIQLKTSVNINGNGAILNGSGSSYIVSAIDVNQIYVQDLYIIPGDNNTYCFYGRKVRYSHFENIFVGQRVPDIRGSDSTIGFAITGGASGSGSYENTFKGITARNCGGDGIVLQMDDAEATPRINANHFFGIHSIGNSGHGLVVIGAYGNLFAGVHVEDNDGYGIVVGKTSGGAISYGNDFLSVWNENNASGTVSLDTDCNSNRFTLANSWPIPDEFKATDGTIWVRMGAQPFASRNGFDAYAIGLRVYSSETDSQPTSQYGKTNYRIGPGGSSPLDTIMERGGPGTFLATGGVANKKQDIAYSTSITPDIANGHNIKVGTLTGNITINEPLNAVEGAVITFEFKQDGTGGRTVSWDPVFKHAWSDTGNAADKRCTISFIYNGTYWIQLGAQSPYF